MGPYGDWERSRRGRSKSKTTKLSFDDSDNSPSSRKTPRATSMVAVAVADVTSPRVHGGSRAHSWRRRTYRPGSPANDRRGSGTTEVYGMGEVRQILIRLVIRATPGLKSGVPDGPFALLGACWTPGQDLQVRPGEEGVQLGKRVGRSRVTQPTNY